MKKGLLFIFVLSLLNANLFAQDILKTNLQRHIAELCSDKMEGRASYSAGERLAMRYVAKELEDAGALLLYPGGEQDFSVVKDGDTLRSANIVAIVEGCDPTLRNEYVVVGAHVDHLGSYNIKINGEDSKSIYRGANDNASGVAVLIELARMISQNRLLFPRSVILVAFGAGEDALSGSWYFADRAFAHMDKVSFMLNLDMVGRSGGGNYPTVFTVMPDIQLADFYNILKEKTIDLRPRLSNSDPFASDHKSFSVKGVPVMLLSSGIDRDNKTLRDTPDGLDYSQMVGVCDYSFALVQLASQTQKILSRNYMDTTKSGGEHGGKVYSIGEVSKRPQFQHGDERQFLERWVYKYINYPSAAIKNGIQGRVIVSFVVNEKGNVEQVEVMDSVSEILDLEAVRVVKASPAWKPAKVAGEPVKCKMSIPVEFRLKR